MHPNRGTCSLTACGMTAKAVSAPYSMTNRTPGARRLASLPPAHPARSLSPTMLGSFSSTLRVMASCLHVQTERFLPLPAGERVALAFGGNRADIAGAGGEMIEGPVAMRLARVPIRQDRRRFIRRERNVELIQPGGDARARAFTYASLRVQQVKNAARWISGRSARSAATSRGEKKRSAIRSFAISPRMRSTSTPTRDGA